MAWARFSNLYNLIYNGQFTSFLAQQQRHLSVHHDNDGCFMAWFQNGFCYANINDAKTFFIVVLQKIAKEVKRQLKNFFPFSWLDLLKKLHNVCDKSNYFRLFKFSSEQAKTIAHCKYQICPLK